MSAGGSSQQIFYRYERDDGRLVIVDSLASVPSEMRAVAERIELPGERQTGALDAAEAGGQVVAPSHASLPSSRSTSPATAMAGDPGWSLDLVSAAVGGLAGVVLTLGLVWAGRRVPGPFAWTLKLAVVVALVAAATGLYFGALRRSVGLDSAAVAHPAQIVRDAQDAVRQLETAREQRDRELEELERLTK